MIKIDGLEFVQKYVAQSKAMAKKLKLKEDGDSKEQEVAPAKSNVQLETQDTSFI